MYSENMLWNQHDTRGSGRMAKTITEPRRKIKMDWKDRLFHTINYTAFILFALICFLHLIFSIRTHSVPPDSSRHLQQLPPQRHPAAHCLSVASEWRRGLFSKSVSAPAFHHLNCFAVSLACAISSTLYEITSSRPSASAFCFIRLQICSNSASSFA